MLVGKVAASFRSKLVRLLVRIIDPVNEVGEGDLS
jgi:hypothetical protein